MSNNFLSFSGTVRLPATMVTLAWASMNMVGLGTLQDFDDGSVTYLWSAFLFTMYYMVSMIVLLNMLIAMMSNSYQQIEACLLLNIIFFISLLDLFVVPSRQHGNTMKCFVAHYNRSFQDVYD